MSSIWSRLINLAGNITGTLGVGNGGTGLASGTSGGVLAFTGSTTLASSGALTANGVVLGGGAGASPTATAAGTNGQLLIGVTSGAPAWGNTISAATTFSGNITSNALLDTSGGTGVKYASSGTSPSTSTMASYSEGTFTPAIAASGTAFSSVTYTSQVGAWQRIGNMVFFTLRVTWNNTTGSPTGNLLVDISGIGLTTRNTTNLNQPVSLHCDVIVFPANNAPVGRLGNNATSFTVEAMASGAGASTALAASNNGATGREIFAAGMYFI